jgi:putative phosphoesterase
MLIGVLSDTHDNLTQIRKAVDYFNAAGVQLVLHAGDIISPFTTREFEKLSCRLVIVFGNNDGDEHLWRTRIAGKPMELYNTHHEETIEGCRVLLMHEPLHVEELAISQRFDVIIYGHTHKADNRMSGKTRILNPGECGGWLYGKSTIATLDLPSKEVRIIDL